MRVSLTACVFTLLSVASVLASPIEDTIENYGMTGIPGVMPNNDTASPGLHPNMHENAIALHEDSASSCGSRWYQTRCRYTCPCGWYYYDSGSHKCNGLCYDSKNVGCRGSCPKGTKTYCGTCTKR